MTVRRPTPQSAETNTSRGHHNQDKKSNQSRPIKNRQQVQTDNKYKVVPILNRSVMWAIYECKNKGNKTRMGTMIQRKDTELQEWKLQEWQWPQETEIPGVEFAGVTEMTWNWRGYLSGGQASEW